MKSKKKATKGKGRNASLYKLSNKRLNKLAKQGKLKKRLPQKKILGLAAERVANADKIIESTNFDDDIPVEEADYEFFDNPSRSMDFLSNVIRLKRDGQQKRKKNKRQDKLENYEKKRRRIETEDDNKKPLLPIKVNGKLVPLYSQILEQAQENLKEETTEHKEPEVQVRSLEEYRQILASKCMTILENPHSHVRIMAELCDIMASPAVQPGDDPSEVVRNTGLSLLEVFKDLLPNYSIRLATQAEKQQKATREVKQMREYEANLLSNYRKYLGLLEGLLKEGTHTKLALHCFVELLSSKPQFNYRKNILALVVPYTNSASTKVSDIVCNGLRRVFRADLSGEVTLEAVRLINRLVKVRQFRVKPKVLKVLLSLKIKEVEDRGVEQLDNKRADKKPLDKKRITRKEKKRSKQTEQLEKELINAAAMTSKKRQTKIHTEIVSVVFQIYFKLLKSPTMGARLLSAVLEGLSKFAHLINIDFFEDLFQVIAQLIASQVLSVEQSLHCVQTGLTLLTGRGSVLNIDPHFFYCHLFRTIRDLNAGVKSRHVALLLECLQLITNKLRKQISFQKLLSFCKRLLTMSLQLEREGAAGVLAAAKTIMQIDSKSSILLDNTQDGTGIFRPELDDPEHCNAGSSCAYELHLLSHHYDKMVQKFARHLLAAAPSSGEGALPSNISHKSPTEVYELLTMDSAIES